MSAAKEGRATESMSGPSPRSRDDDDLEMDCPALKDGDMNPCRQSAAPREKSNFVSLLGDPFPFKRKARSR